jgi:hypothetical protein
VAPPPQPGAETAFWAHFVAPTLREVFRVTDGKERHAERSVEPEVIRRRHTSVFGAMNIHWIYCS